MYKRVTLSGLALLGMFAGANALAEVQPGFYVGASVGQASIEIDDDLFDGDDTAFKVFGGYNFSPNFAVELTYLDAGKPDETILPGATVEFAVDALNLSALGRVPLGEVFSLFGKIGFASYDAEGTGRVNGGVVYRESGSDEDLSYGVGGAFDFGAFELRGEYEAIDISDGSFSVLSIGGLYKF